MQVSPTRARRANIGPAWSARRAVQRAEFHRFAADAPPFHPVLPIYDKLSALLGRPLRILSVGAEWEKAAAQLVARGATVHGECDVDPATATLSGDDDLALVERDAGTHALPQALAASSAATVVVALRGSSSGETRSVSRLMLREAFAFVQELDQPSGQRPDMQLWFASNRFWLLSDEIGAFDQFRSEPHSAACGAHEGSRRYYLGGGRLVKHFVFDNARLRDANLKELRGEIRFLRNPPPGFPVPRLIATGERQDESWLIRDYFEGKLLLDLMRDGASFDAHTVLLDVLRQLVVLEVAGLHHNDVRPWNVVIGRDGRASLIDYGAIGPDTGDCEFPSNLFMAFLVFACEVWGGAPSRLHGACLPRFDPDYLPPPYQSAFWSMLQSPPSQWRFARLLDDIVNPKTVEPLDPLGLRAVLRAANECAIKLDARLTQSAAEIADLGGKLRTAKHHEINLTSDLASTATALETKTAEIEQLRVEVHDIGTREAGLATELAATTRALEEGAAGLNALGAKVHEAGGREAELTASLAATTDALERSRAEAERYAANEALLLASSRAEAERQAANEMLLREQLAAFRQSTSWRLTAPLRLLRRLAGRFGAPPVI